MLIRLPLKRLPTKNTRNGKLQLKTLPINLLRESKPKKKLTKLSKNRLN